MGHISAGSERTVRTKRTKRQNGWGKSAKESDKTQRQKEAVMAERKIEETKERMWLDAWSDPVAGFHSFSGGFCLSKDELIVGDLSGFLKVFSGGKNVSQVALHGVPTAVRSFFEDGNRELVAVACGSKVYVCNRIAPVFKFSLDPVKVSDAEQRVWEKANERSLNAIEVCQALRNLGGILSERSLELLALESDSVRLEEHLEMLLLDGAYKTPIQTCITCMEVLFKRHDSGDHSPGLLVLGTESNKVLLLDPTSRSIVRTVNLRSVPVFLAVTGSVDVEYRIVVACRDKRVYSIKNGDLIRSCIQLESPVCGGIVRCGKDIVVGCMDRTVHSFHFKGRKNWSLRMPDMITNISLFNCERISSSGFFVALRNGQVRLYMEKTLMSTIETPGQIVTGLQFGRFNREPNTLIMLFTSGALQVKMLRRTAKLDPSKTPLPGPPPEQDIPLPVPKKTKMYLDQTQREREMGAEMHRTFQHSLCKIRYVTAKSYLELFRNSGTANAQLYTSSNQIVGADDSKERLNVSVQVQGVGPQFRLTLSVENVGNLPIVACELLVRFSAKHFDVERAFVPIPALIPQLVLKFDVPILNLLPGAAAPPVQVCIAKQGATLVLADVEMPVVEATI